MGLKQKLPSKLFSPVGLAIAMSVILVFWLIIGDHKSAADEAPADAEKAEKPIPQVEFKWSSASEQENHVIAQAEVEPWQTVIVKAQVAGQINEVVMGQGSQVLKGETLIRLSDEGRSERLEQAKANLSLQKSELNSAKTLEKSNYTSETELSRLRSNLAQSQADLVAAELAVKHSAPEAPFDGLVDREHVEMGEWVSLGENLVTVVDVSKLKVIASIPQQEVGRLQVGQPVTVRLLDGREMQAEVSFISFAADSETRSYYVEITAFNPENWRVAGASATVEIHLKPVMAHSFSPALLSLDKQGGLGVFAVDDQDTVEFYPIKILSVDNKAAVVAGLPDKFRMITLGAGFVDPGQKVKAVEGSL